MASSNDGWEEVPVEAASSDGWEEVPLDAGRMSDEEIILRGILQGGLYDGADEIGAAGKATWDVATTDKGITDWLDSYRGNRDGLRKGFKEAEETDPDLYMGSQIGGGVATALLPGGLLPKAVGYAAKGAGAIGKILHGAKIGAIEGGLFGLGASEGDLTKPDMGEYAKVGKDVVQGAGTGAVIGGGIPAAIGLGKGAVALPGALARGTVSVADKLLPKANIRGKIQGFANEKAVKSLGPMLAHEKNLQRKGIVQSLGQELNEQGVTGFGQGIKGTAEKLSPVLQKKGEAIGDTRARVSDKAGKMDMGSLKRKGNQMIRESIGDIGPEQDVAIQFFNEAQRIMERPQRSVLETQALIEKISKHINFKKPFTDMTAQEKALVKLRQHLVNKIDYRVKQHAPDEFSDYLKNKEQFGLFAEGDKIAKDALARKGTNRSVSLTDNIIGANMAGGSAARNGVDPGSTITGMGFALANKLARERGNSTMAWGAHKLAGGKVKSPIEVADRLSPKFAQALQNAARRGGNAVAVTHFLLSQSDPQFRQEMEAIEKDEQEQ